MTLLAEGTLKLDSFSVAKQALSLPSSSHSSARKVPKAVEREVEGDAYLRQADNGLDSSSPSQGPVATATAESQQALADASKVEKESKRESQEATLEAARAAERERLEKATEELNQKLNQNLSLRFGEDQASGKDFFQLIEKETGDVVQQIPSQDVLDFVQKFRDFSGLLFNHDA